MSVHTVQPDPELALALLRSQTTAAWVQAIGSITAIVAGFGAVVIQHWLESRRTRHAAAGERERYVSGLSALIQVQSGMAVAMRRQAEVLFESSHLLRFWFSAPLTTLTELGAMARTFALTSLGYWPQLWLQWAVFLRSEQEAVGAAKNLAVWLDNQTDDGPVDAKLAQEMLRAFDGLEHAAHSLREEIEGKLKAGTVS